MDEIVEWMEKLDHYQDFPNFLKGVDDRRSSAAPPTIPLRHSQGATNVSFCIFCLCIPIPRSYVVHLKRAFTDFFCPWRRNAVWGWNAMMKMGPAIINQKTYVQLRKMRWRIHSDIH